MKPRWRKLGHVYAPRGDRWWARSHALLPTPEVRENGTVIRVYFAALDQDQYGRIGYVDLAAEDPRRVMAESPEPVLGLGAPGAFDDAGVNPSCCLRHGSRLRLYYIGWQRGVRVPYLLFSGLAEAEDGEEFRRVQPTPVLDRTPAEPFLRSAPSVLAEEGGFRAWYVSALGWTEVGGKPYPTYVIRHARSADGVVWRTEGPVCIDFQDADEFGFGRPWVMRDGDVYRMWYSIRSRSAPYRLGYAESFDGLNWERRDAEAGLARSDEGWDAEMICYASVVDAGGRRYLFYNGSGLGRSGFGCAVWVG